MRSCIKESDILGMRSLFASARFVGRIGKEDLFLLVSGGDLMRDRNSEERGAFYLPLLIIGIRLANQLI